MTIGLSGASTFTVGLHAVSISPKAAAAAGLKRMLAERNLLGKRARVGLSMIIGFEPFLDHIRHLIPAGQALRRTSSSRPEIVRSSSTG